MQYPVLFCHNQSKNNHHEQRNIYPLSKARTDRHEHRETSQHHPDSSNQLSRHLPNPYSTHRPERTGILLDRSTIRWMYRTGFCPPAEQRNRSIHPVFPHKGQGRSCRCRQLRSRQQNDPRHRLALISSVQAS